MAGGDTTFNWSSATATLNVGEAITVTSTVASISGLSYTVADPTIATATTQNYTSWTITGVSAGTTTVTVNGASSGSTVLTVTVNQVDDNEFLNKRGLTHFWDNIDTLKQDKLTTDTVTADMIVGGGTASTLASGALVEVVGTTTGDYNYAWKYADGRLICFQQYSWSGKNCVSYGQLYSASVKTPKNYAVQFTALPAVTVNLINSTGQWNGWICSAFESGTPTVSKPAGYQFIRPTGGTNTNGTLCLVAYGYWK